jgi:hypothetical protein
MLESWVKDDGAWEAAKLAQNTFMVIMVWIFLSRVKCVTDALLAGVLADE